MSQLPTITVLGSHSALDVCRGAKDQGFKTLVVAQKDRAQTYTHYYKTEDDTGCVDDVLVLDKFNQILNKSSIHYLQDRNAIFIPHRSFQVYLNFDYDAIETRFPVPIFGNRRLLKIEERISSPNQYDLMEQAGIPHPRIITDPKDIDGLVMVKITDAKSGFERAFFLASGFNDFIAKAKAKIKSGDFTQEQLENATIEDFIVGVHVNFNFFYSPLSKRLELIGTDSRRQTNKDGIVTTPAPYQDQILEHTPLSYHEAGHIAVTLLESQLEHVFDLGQRFVKTAKKAYPPGVIGPFALQAIITPGTPKQIYVIDISPRMPGSPGIAATPYSAYLHGRPLSMGARIALEINQAFTSNQLDRLLT